MPSSQTTDQQPLVSPLAADPDFAELIVLFVEELQEQMCELGSAVESLDHQAIHGLAHAIKGSAGGYGFDSVTDAARDLDELAKVNAEANQVNAAFEQLRGLCNRIQI